MRARTALISHSGGLGDIVLVSQFIGSIKCAHPEWNVTLACNAAWTDVARMFPVLPDEVIPLGVNPYRWAAISPELIDEVRPLIERLQSRTAALYVSAELQPTWLGWFLPSVLATCQAVCCTAAEPPERLIANVCRSFGLTPQPLRRIAPPDGIHELERYEVLLQALETPECSFFPWVRPERTREKDYLICFPTGSPSTQMKRWPVDHFAAVLERFRARWGLPVVLLGSAEERAELQALAQRIGGADVFSGKPLAEVSATVAHARAYLGNDTGPMHLAQAYSVPGVAIFGGGTWPHYAPWGTGSVGLVKPIPCFGCNWDCAFDQGICVENITVEEVDQALDDVMEGERLGPETRSLAGVDPKMERLIRNTSAKYRMLQRDREARLVALEATSAACQEQQCRIESLLAAAEAQHQRK
jgi:ADP-heptose:LPS heptosyltransferase